nr:hypothetical protein Q903MT_gene1207 [Picea sitchensis]
MGQARSGNTQSQGLVLPRSLYSSRFMLLDPFRTPVPPIPQSRNPQIYNTWGGKLRKVVTVHLSVVRSEIVACQIRK